MALGTGPVDVGVFVNKRARFQGKLRRKVVRHDVLGVPKKNLRGARGARHVGSAAFPNVVAVKNFTRTMDSAVFQVIIMVCVV